MSQPLAYRVRPKKINDIVGQSHLIGENKFISNMLKSSQLFSIIMYGPPGIGKTSIANALINEYNYPSDFFNAAIDNKKKLAQIISTAELYDNFILVLDEIHRMKKDIQDYLLPYIENGTIILIGLTTSNPYFAINSAIRSRCHILQLFPLNNEDIIDYIEKQAKIQFPLITFEQDVYKEIVSIANGDLRTALNLLELFALSANNENIVNVETIKEVRPKNKLMIDKNGDGHYDTLSAFQKSIRGSDVNASLHYLARLIKAEDMESICRRLVVIGYEDIGLANPELCARVVNAVTAAERLGFPEARIPLANIVTELALSPKSQTAYKSLDKALNDLNTIDTGDIPEFIKYKPVNPKVKYDSTYPGRWKWDYMPEKIRHIEYFKPKEKSSDYESLLKDNYLKIKQLKSKK